MKVVVTMIIQDVEDYVAMALSSVMGWADKIVIVDGGSKDNTIEVVERLKDERFIILSNPYDKGDLGMDGKQRNVYLQYVQQHCVGWWCLVIDADEVVSDNGYTLKTTLDVMQKNGYNVASPHMEHFVYSLKHVDNTMEKHHVPNRLFQIQEGLHYPEVEHNILQVPDAKGYNCDSITIFHLGYIRGLFDVMVRYKKNLAKSNIHDEQFLTSWKNSHILGHYPVRVYEGEYPRAIREYFGVDK